MADVKLSQLAANSPASVAAGATLWTGKAAIMGLALEYVSATQFRVTSGAAWVPDAGQLVELAASATITLSGIGNSAWAHVYLVYAAGQAPTIEAVTTDPAAPYYGSARAKSGTGGTSRRYLGSIRTNATGQIIRFHHNPSANLVSYLADINGSGLYVLNTGTATASTNVAAPVVPLTARSMLGFAENTDPTALVFISQPDMGAASSSNILLLLRGTRVLMGVIALDASQRFNYAYSTAPSSGNGLSVWCTGYYFDR